MSKRERSPLDKEADEAATDDDLTSVTLSDVSSEDEEDLGQSLRDRLIAEDAIAELSQGHVVLAQKLTARIIKAWAFKDKLTLDKAVGQCERAVVDAIVLRRTGIGMLVADPRIWSMLDVSQSKRMVSLAKKWKRMCRQVAAFPETHRSLPIKRPFGKMKAVTFAQKANEFVDFFWLNRGGPKYCHVP